MVVKEHLGRGPDVVEGGRHGAPILGAAGLRFGSMRVRKTRSYDAFG